MRIKDLFTVEQDTSVSIHAYMVKIEKKIMRIGDIFYIVELIDFTGKAQSCVCPQHYEHGIEKFDLEASFVKSYHIDLKCISSDKYALPLFYIENIKESK